MRSQGKLNFGSKIMAENDTYVGELDEDGNACGEGIRTRPNGTTWKGTFY